MTKMGIIEIVAAETGIPLIDIISRRRSRPIVEARQLAVYFIRIELKEKVTAIAHYFGSKDHSLVTYSLKCLRNLLPVDYELRDKFNRIKSSIAK